MRWKFPCDLESLYPPPQAHKKNLKKTRVIVDICLLNQLARFWVHILIIKIYIELCSFSLRQILVSNFGVTSIIGCFYLMYARCSKSFFIQLLTWFGGPICYNRVICNALNERQKRGFDHSLREVFIKSLLSCRVVESLFWKLT